MNKFEQIINKSSQYKIYKFCKTNRFTHYINKTAEPDKLLLIKIRYGLKTWNNSNFNGVEIFIFDEYSKLFIHTTDEFKENFSILTKRVLEKYNNFIDNIDSYILNKIDIYFDKYKIDNNLQLDDNITTLEHTIQCTICKIFKLESKFQKGQLQCIKCRSPRLNM